MGIWQPPALPYRLHMEVINAEIEHIQAQIGEFKDISTEDLEAMNADIVNLKGYTADFSL